MKKIQKVQKTFPLLHTIKGEPFYLTWTIHPDPPEPLIIKTSNKTYTLVDETEEILNEWYANLGQPVPKFDKECIAIWRKKENEEMEYIRKIVSKEIVIACEEPKAAYGTPEFWKQYWAKKKALAK